MGIKLTARQAEALASAAAAWDRSVTSTTDMRVLGPLIRRGLLTAKAEDIHYYSPRKGYWVSRTHIVDIKITGKGMAAIKDLQERGMRP